VTQNQRLGTGIVDSIQDYADSLRLKRRQMAEAKAGEPSCSCCSLSFFAWRHRS